MITRWFLLVIIFCFSLSALAQCPDFNPELRYEGADVICELAPPSIIEYSFGGDPNEIYDVQLYFGRTDEI